MQIVLPVIYTLLLFILLVKFGKDTILTKPLLLFYFISAVAGLLVFITEPDAEMLYRTQYYPLLFLLPVLIVWFFSFTNFNSEFVDNLELETIRLEKICVYIGIYFLPLTAILAYNAYNILTTVDLSYFRIDADYQKYYQGGKFFSLAYYSAFLSFIPHFLTFYAIKYNFKPYVVFLLLFASFAFVFQTLCNAGRDGIAYWIMNSYVFYCLFNSSLSVEQKKQVRKIALIVLVPLSLVFLIISSFRFLLSGTIDLGELMNPIISYLGQPMHIFCQSFYLSPNEMEGTYLSWTFGTFIKHYLIEYGYSGCVIATLIYFMVIRFFVHVANRDNTIWDFFIVYLLYQIPLYGVFYYRQGIQNMEVLYLIFAGLFLIMKFFTRQKANAV